MKLILIRYGEHENGHLNELGKQTMISTAQRLNPIVENKNTCIVSAKVPRAIESAQIIKEYLHLPTAQSFSELYAAEEEGIYVNLESAVKIINSLGEKYAIVITVTSREYIETLPSYILKNLGSQTITKTRLNRGEIIVLDYDRKDITYIK